MGGHTAYNISKMGMTMVALGVAEENVGLMYWSSSLQIAPAALFR
jgi:hypothetical protein